MSNVLLLRAPASDGPDKYEAAFNAIAYHPVSVPVLETVVVNLPELRKVIAEGPHAKSLGGVVVTSARSCEAWREAVEEIVRNNPPESADWTRVPFYVVGDATATALTSLSSIPNSHTLVPPSTNIRGAESGTGEKLAHFILSDLPQHYPDAPRKLLFLTGDKNRDVLPNILKEGGVELEPLQVYATQGSSTFVGDLEEALEKVSPDQKDKDWWIVFFAPSAAEFVLPTLRQHFDIPSVGSKTLSAKIAAIGPTTATFLRDKLALRVDVSPPKPSPEALATAIRDFNAADASL